MRITKSPEERRDEIIEAAIELFSTKGYHKTSMSDIAKKLNVAQGLCYRYFPSKEVLFDNVIDKYADEIVEGMTKELRLEKFSLRECIENMSRDEAIESGIYYEFFHNNINDNLHELLSLRICLKLMPIVKNLIDLGNKSGEINIEDVDTFASFCVYGQIGIINNEELSVEEKNRKIKSFLLKIFNL